MLMNKFFDDIKLLNQFSLNLDSSGVSCPHCGRCGTLVSHGFIYRKSHGQSASCVGKRVYCENRRGKMGCGRTISLFILDIIPKLHYRASILNVFVQSLLHSSSVNQAYHEATGQHEPRNAWRWLKRLKALLGEFRQCLFNHHRKPLTDTRVFPNKARHRQLTALLCSLLALHRLWGKNLCAQYQQNTQLAFI